MQYGIFKTVFVPPPPREKYRMPLIPFSHRDLQMSFLSNDVGWNRIWSPEMLPLICFVLFLYIGNQTGPDLSVPSFKYKLRPTFPGHEEQLIRIAGCADVSPADDRCQQVELGPPSGKIRHSDPSCGPFHTCIEHCQSDRVAEQNVHLLAWTACLNVSKHCSLLSSVVFTKDNTLTIFFVNIFLLEINRYLGVTEIFQNYYSGLFNDACSSLEYIVSNDKMIHE
jgi:hypothetical protein